MSGSMTGVVPAQSLREFLGRLDRAGDLIRVTEEVDSRFAISAWLAELRAGPALFFSSVAGHSVPVVGNVANSRSRLAQAIGVQVSQLTTRLLDAVNEPIPPCTIPVGACQEITREFPDLRELPIPWFFERESAPYITAGAVIAEHPDTGKRNLSFARLKLLGDNRAMIGISPNHHLSQMASAALARGQMLEVAVAIGLPPAYALGAALYLELGEDELRNVGGLLGKGVDVVPCLSVALDVPAECEIVLEGRLDPEEVHEEGLVSEFHGLYEDYGSGPVVSFQMMTHRRDPILQVIEPGRHPEHLLIGGVAIAAILRRHLARTIPRVCDVAVDESGCGRLTAVVSLSDPEPGDAWMVAFATWSHVKLIKQVTVVDNDVDVWDISEVEWARITRMRFDRDALVVPGASTDRSDPLERDGMITKVVFDATKKSGDRRAGFDAATPPARVLENVKARIAELGLDGRRGA